MTLLTERLVLLLSQRTTPTTGCPLELTAKKSAEKICRLRDFSSVDFELRIEKDLAELAIDPEQCRSLLSELVRNSCQAITRSQALAQGAIVDDLDLSTIQIEAHIEAHIEAASVGDRTRITISNFSKLPCPLDLNRIFEPLVTEYANQKQIGLGLAVAWAIVERFGGTIEACEEPWEDGYKFSVIVRLPQMRGNIAAANTSAPVTGHHQSASQESSRKPLNVLLIEDETGVATAIEKILFISLGEAYEFRMSLATGKEALDMLEAGTVFDAIFCDLHLSKTSGRFIFEHLSQKWPEAKKHFAFLTGDRSPHETQAYLTSTGRPALYKPFEPDELVNLTLRLAGE
jgi:CheY-like chemotaxis protein